MSRPTAPTPPTKVELEAWRRTIFKAPRAKPSACYAATYPEREWHEIACIRTSHKPYPPRRHGGITSATIVGDTGPDFSPSVTGGITEADGSFDSATVSGTECSVPCPNNVCPANPSCSGLLDNEYSLQLNTEPFTTSACGSSSSSLCQGWEQFVYEGGGAAFIQYWLVDYIAPNSNAQCPMPSPDCAPGGAPSDGWCPFAGPEPGYFSCAISSATVSPGPATAMQLDMVHLTGTAASAGSDGYMVSVASQARMLPGSNYFSDLASQWHEFEFNVFGTGGGSQAIFGAGTTLMVRSGVTSGTASPPMCNLRTFTGESNNLTLVNMAPTALPGSEPALVFSESVPPPGGAVATCADATSIGDTHLTTFNGLYYDFQAAGDFVLADRGADFTVQNRQVSGAPTWPNAAVNTAVGARMGRTTVAVCLPGRLEINGNPTNVSDGASLTLSDGVAVTRTGNVYLVANVGGASLRALVNDGWIDASVGLCRWPSRVRGLLANVNDNPSQIATSDGAVLTEPVSFEDLYRRYGESWRVRDGESILCGGLRIEKGIPTKPFYANDLDRRLADPARAVCDKAGVKDGPHMESCILDVAVIGKDAAAKAFAAQRPPVVVAAAAKAIAPQRWPTIVTPP